jgi:hypothetical protein
MKNKYVNFISDKHFLSCIKNLHDSYLTAKNNISKQTLFSNKVDTFKLTFDSKFNKIDEENLIKAEILRQIDKSINNAIGTFHEEILGGVNGYERGNNSGYDIKATNDTLFADIKNKWNTMNSGASESLYQKLQRYAESHPKSKCYWVQILAKGSFNERWISTYSGRKYNHDRVYKISGDQFYKLLTHQEDAFFQLYNALPIGITDFLNTIECSELTDNTALTEINKNRSHSKRSLIDEITFQNFSYYIGFSKI